MARASPEAELSERPSRREERSRLRVVVDVMSVVSRPNTAEEMGGVKKILKKTLFKLQKDFFSGMCPSLGQYLVEESC